MPLAPTRVVDHRDLHHLHGGGPQPLEHGHDDPVGAGLGLRCELHLHAREQRDLLPVRAAAAAVAPVATKMFNAAANTGQGAQTVTPTWSLSVPSTTWAGGAGNPYTSTWTFTLVSGP